MASPSIANLCTHIHTRLRINPGHFQSYDAMLFLLDCPEGEKEGGKEGGREGGRGFPIGHCTYLIMTLTLLALCVYWHTRLRVEG